MRLSPRLQGWLPLLLMGALIVALSAFTATKQEAFLTTFNLNNLLLATLPLAPAVQEPEPSEPTHHLDRRVRPDAEDGEERLGRAVAAQEHDARAEWPERRTRIELLAVAGRRSRGPLRTSERPEELHLPVALRARDSDDLAARHLEIDRPEPIAP